MPASDLLSFDNPVFAGYVYYSSLVLMKMFGMAVTTSLKRLITDTYANPEDCSAFSKKKESKPVFNNERLERVRRNHQNDLENIPAFALLGLFYVLSKPDPNTALWHFRLFAGSRFLHTLCYQVPLPQPSRAVFFWVGIAVCASMGVQLIMKSW